MYDKPKMTGGLGKYVKAKVANRMAAAPAAPRMPERKADMMARATKIGNVAAKMGKRNGRA